MVIAKLGTIGTCVLIITMSELFGKRHLILCVSVVIGFNVCGKTGKSELMTLGQDSQVYVWDVGQRQCVRKWKDDGGYGSSIMAADRSGHFLGIG